MVKLHNDEKVRRGIIPKLETHRHCVGDLAISSGVLSFMGHGQALVSQVPVPNDK